MSNASQTPGFYIGWDVGAWHCKTSGESCDAIVILDSALTIVGKPWRGNLKPYINEAATTANFLRKLFNLCAASQSDDVAQITLAIDAPLGFSEAFLCLVTTLKPVDQLDDFRSNHYLFRQTERFLYDHGLKPLSAIQDQIGSQATKGMHVLGKFASKRQRCGVWTDGGSLTAIEAYPSATKGSATMSSLRRRFPDFGHKDKRDALTCALISYLFATAPDTLASPDMNVPSAEGWIWVPMDGLKQQT